MKQRKLEISLLNVLFCLLVIFIHVTSEPVLQLDKSSPQYLLVMIPSKLSLFVVPGFIFLSGLKLFLNKPEKIDYGKIYLSKLKTVALPYILWALIYYFYFVYRGYMEYDLAGLLKGIVAGDIVCHFYFITLILQFYALIPLWFRLIKKTGANSVPVIVAVSLMITVISEKYLSETLNLFFPDFYYIYSDRTFTSYLVYWIAGCFVGAYYDSFKAAVKKSLAAMTVAFVLTTSLYLYLNYIGSQKVINFNLLEDVHILYNIVAILFLFGIALLISERSSLKFTLVKEIDKASYLIYLVHVIIIYIVDDYLSNYGVYSYMQRYIVRFAVTYAVSIGLCVLWKYAVGIIKNKLQTAAADGRQIK